MGAVVSKNKDHHSALPGVRLGCLPVELPVAVARYRSPEAPAATEPEGALDMY